MKIYLSFVFIVKHSTWTLFRIMKKRLKVIWFCDCQKGVPEIHLNLQCRLHGFYCFGFHRYGSIDRCWVIEAQFPVCMKFVQMLKTLENQTNFQDLELIKQLNSLRKRRTAVLTCSLFVSWCNTLFLETWDIVFLSETLETNVKVSVLNIELSEILVLGENLNYKL